MRISDWSADVCSSDLIVREGKKIALLSLGTRLGEAEAAAAKLDAMGLSTTVADMRFAKPLDLDLVRKLAANHELLITIEEGAIGGFGAHVLTIASDEGLTDAGLKIRTLRLPDVFQDHEQQTGSASCGARGCQYV